MLGNIEPRPTIHARKTPQRDGSILQDDPSPENSRNSISTSGSDAENENSNKGVNRKKTMVTTSHSIKKKRELERLLEPESFGNPTKDCQNSNTCGNYFTTRTLIWTISILLLILVVACKFYYNSPKEKRVCPFKNLKKEYPNEKESTWNELRIGVEITLNKQIEKPVVFLLAHHGSQKSSGLIANLTQETSNCFGTNLTQMESNDFISSVDNYGSTIKRYKDLCKEGDVILIANLNEIPAHAARALHTICDTHTPILKNVVIFLTLTIRKNIKGNAHNMAEETLTQMWGPKLKYNELQALITRVTDQVIILES